MSSEYFEKTTEFCRMVLERQDPKPDGALIHVPSHGEEEMTRRIDEFGQRLRYSHNNDLRLAGRVRKMLECFCQACVCGLMLDAIVLINYQKSASVLEGVQ